MLKRAFCNEATSLHTCMHTHGASYKFIDWPCSAPCGCNAAVHHRCHWVNLFWNSVL